MKPTELTEFENLTNSMGYAKKYYLKMDNSRVIVEYDCEMCKFLVTRNYAYFKGSTWNTGNPVTAKNYIFILSHVEDDENAQMLISVCGINSGVELQDLRELIALHTGLTLTPEQYLLFGITQDFLKLCRTAKEYGI